jgi:hypothetical protein
MDIIPQNPEKTSLPPQCFLLHLLLQISFTRQQEEQTQPEMLQENGS